MILLFLRFGRRIVDEGRGLAVQELEVGQVLHNVPEEGHFFFGTRVVLEGEFFEDGEFDQLAGLEVFDFDSVVGEVAFF